MLQIAYIYMSFVSYRFLFIATALCSLCRLHVVLDWFCYVLHDSICCGTVDVDAHVGIHRYFVNCMLRIVTGTFMAFLCFTWLFMGFIQVFMGLCMC